MKTETARFITAIVDARLSTSSRTPRHLGTGFFLDAGESGCVVTAQHVVQKADDQSHVGFSRGNGKQLVRPESGWTFSTNSADLAVARLWPGALAETTKELLPIARLANCSSNIGDDFLFIQGFPGVHAKLLLDGMGNSTRSLLSGLGVETETTRCGPGRFLMRYGSEMVAKSDGTPSEVPPPAGMSGSPIWRANWNGNPSTWSPAMAVVVGVAVEMSELDPLIIAENVETLREHLKLWTC